MIKLDQDNWTLHTVIKWILVSKTPNPREIHLGLELADLLHLQLPRPPRQVEEILLEDAVEEGLLVRCEGGGGDLDAFIGHDAVVAVGAADVALVVAVPAAWGHGGIVHVFVDAGFLL